MLKRCRSFIFAVASVLMACAAFVGDVFLLAADMVAEHLTPKKLEIEVAQNAMQKVTNDRKLVSSGRDSGDSAIGFVSMLKAVNSRSFSAAA